MCLTSKNVSTLMAILLVVLTIGNEVSGAVFTQKAYNHPGNYIYLPMTVVRKKTNNIFYNFSLSWKVL